jgi:exodeoxyribonuclease VII small subunit
VASFEEQLAELEKVVEQLEQGDLPLEKNVALFERGVELSRVCKAKLSDAESRIQALVDPQESGAVRTEELDVEDVVDGEEDD